MIDYDYITVMKESTVVSQQLTTVGFFVAIVLLNFEMAIPETKLAALSLWLAVAGYAMWFGVTCSANPLTFLLSCANRD
jgi:hypothetical protein